MIQRCVSRIPSSLLAFAKWYWRQIKRSPRDFALFAAGGVYVAFLLLPYLVH